MEEKKESKKATKSTTKKVAKTTNKKSVAKKAPAKKTTSSEKKVSKVDAAKAKIITKKVEIENNIAEDSKKIQNTNKKIETLRIGIVFGFVGILALIAIICAIISNNNSHKIVDMVKDTMSNSESQMIYIDKDGCSYCEVNEANMTALKDEYDVKYLEVNLSKLTKEDKDEIFNTLNIDTNDFGTPYVVITKDNKVIDTLDGVQPFNKTFDLLKKDGIIKSDSKLQLNYINYEQFKKIITSKDNQIVVIAASTCHYCLGERPVLDEIVRETGVKINWMYLDQAFTSGNEEKEYDEFKNSLDWFKTNSDWGTPTTLIVKNKKVVSALSGYREKDDVLRFYKQNGMISE